MTAGLAGAGLRALTFHGEGEWAPFFVIGDGNSASSIEGRPWWWRAGNGVAAVERALELIIEGSDPLDAAIAGVNLVGRIGRLYGWLRRDTQRGSVIQLDACCMHGPTHRAGAGRPRGYKTPSRVAKLVLEQTDHVLLVGRGALEFAKLFGSSRRISNTLHRELYAYWKGAVSGKDEYLPPRVDSLRPDVQAFIRKYGKEDYFYPERPPAPACRRHHSRRCTGRSNATHRRIGNVGGVRPTSGLSSDPGPRRDSPIPGRGLYVDNDVGAAGRRAVGRRTPEPFSFSWSSDARRSAPHRCVSRACRRIVEKTSSRAPTGRTGAELRRDLLRAGPGGAIRGSLHLLGGDVRGGRRTRRPQAGRCGGLSNGRSRSKRQAGTPALREQALGGTSSSRRGFRAWCRRPRGTSARSCVRDAGHQRLNGTLE